jgi:hypothetical protein
MVHHGNVFDGPKMFQVDRPLWSGFTKDLNGHVKSPDLSISQPSLNQSLGFLKIYVSWANILDDMWYRMVLFC